MGETYIHPYKTSGQRKRLNMGIKVGHSFATSASVFLTNGSE